MDNVRYDITWTAPDPTDRGTTIAYEVSAQRTAADCARFVNVGSQDDCTAPRVSLITLPSFSIYFSHAEIITTRPVQTIYLPSPICILIMQIFNNLLA